MREPEAVGKQKDARMFRNVYFSGDAAGYQPNKRTPPPKRSVDLANKIGCQAQTNNKEEYFKGFTATFQRE